MGISRKILISLILAIMVMTPAYAAEESAAPPEAPAWTVPESFNPREFGRVSEEVMMLMRTAKPGDIFLIVERLAESADRIRYYQYTGQKDGFVMIEVIEKVVNIDTGFDRIEGTKKHALPLDFTDKTSMDITDFYDNPIKILLSTADKEGGLTVQSVRERAVVVADPGME